VIEADNQMIAQTMPAAARRFRPGTLRRVHEVYAATIVAQGRAEGFLITLSFLITTSIIRGITHAIRDQRFPFLHSASTGGVHIHHFVYGILILLVAGFLAIRFHPNAAGKRRALAISYGAAAALVLDEFALWLRLEDVYWSPQGQESVYAMILAGAMFAVLVEGLGFWRALLRDIAWLAFRRTSPFPQL
jgi:hypothetical protein